MHVVDRRNPEILFELPCKVRVRHAELASDAGNPDVRAVILGDQTTGFAGYRRAFVEAVEDLMRALLRDEMQQFLWSVSKRRIAKIECYRSR